MQDCKLKRGRKVLHIFANNKVTARPIAARKLVKLALIEIHRNVFKFLM